MSSPEDRLRSLELGSMEAEAKGESKMYGGRLSLMHTGINFASGSFVTKCLLEMSGTAEKVSPTEQYLLVAVGGLAATIAVLRTAHKNTGVNLAELVQWRKEKSKAQNLDAKYQELSSWMEGPNELSLDDETAI